MLQAASTAASAGIIAGALEETRGGELYGPSEAVLRHDSDAETSRFRRVAIGNHVIL